MSKPSNDALAQCEQDRSPFVLAGTIKNPEAEPPRFILAISMMVGYMRSAGGVLLLLTSLLVSPADAYKPTGFRWPEPTTTFFVDIPGAQGLWNQSFAAAMSIWSADTLFEYSIVPGVHEDPCDPPAGRNGVSFDLSDCGNAWGATTISTTHLWFAGSTLTQTDIVFNSNEVWSVYSTPWRSGDFAGINDFQRVAVHELGHALGLGHEDSGVATIMTTQVSNITTPQQDDIEGVAAIYGAPPPPPPPPAPVSGGGGGGGCFIDTLAYGSRRTSSFALPE